MGLVAREIERRGVATVALSIVREITAKLPPPRALFLRFPFGHALGEGGAVDQHFAVLRLAFELLFAADEPGAIHDATFKWRRESYPTPNWATFQRIGE